MLRERVTLRTGALDTVAATQLFLVPPNSGPCFSGKIDYIYLVNTLIFPEMKIKGSAETTGCTHFLKKKMANIPPGFYPSYLAYHFLDDF